MKIKIGSEHAIKPCRALGICPYGPLVEEFPLSEERTNRSCSVFGHDCPIFYVAEAFQDESAEVEVTEEEIKKFLESLI